jgi:site-specific recombinase XerD
MRRKHRRAYLAGHSDFSTTKRYVHPKAETIRAAM